MRDVIDNGEFVACDFCNYGEETLGGVMVGTYAICGDCAKTISHPEEIQMVFDQTKTFRQNVLNYRQEAYGETEAKIEFYTWEDYLNNMLD